MKEKHYDCSGSNNPNYRKKHTLENIEKIRNAFKGEKSHRYKGKVQQYTLGGVFIREGLISKFVSYGFSQGSISNCINHPEINKSHKGFIWKRNIKFDI